MRSRTPREVDPTGGEQPSVYLNGRGLRLERPDWYGVFELGSECLQWVRPAGCM